MDCTPAFRGSAREEKRCFGRDRVVDSPLQRSLVQKRAAV